MIRGIHYFSAELKMKIDVIPRGCFKFYPHTAELLLTIFHLYEAVIANAIYSFR